MQYVYELTGDTLSIKLAIAPLPTFTLCISTRVKPSVNFNCMATAWNIFNTNSKQPKRIIWWSADYGMSPCMPRYSTQKAFFTAINWTNYYDHSLGLLWPIIKKLSLLIKYYVWRLLVTIADTLLFYVFFLLSTLRFVRVKGQDTMNAAPSELKCTK